MRKHNFEDLTRAQNEAVNKELTKCQQLVSRGLITIAEADYWFHEWVRESFSKKVSFTICTNRGSFTKGKDLPFY